MSSAGRSAWELAFRYSPILLTGGLAQSLPGGILPILALTDAAALAQGLLSGNFNFFANWQVLPGGTLVNQKVATYPFANQVVAANATIQDANSVSMMMICPAVPSALGSVAGAVVGALGGTAESLLTGSGIAPGAIQGALAGSGGYLGKQATMTALQSTIAQHNALGGTYSVLTGAYIYANCIMGNPGITDVSSEGETHQTQVRWRWDFVQPQVITLAQAQTALNNLANRLSQGLPLTGSTNLGATSYGLGAGPSVSALQAIYPGAQGITGTTGIPQ